MARVKICRIRHAPVFSMLAKFGVDYAGIHLIDRIDDQRVVEAQSLCHAARDCSIQPVVLTKVADAEAIFMMMKRLGATWLQLHRHWPIADLRHLRGALDRMGEVRLIHLLSPDVADDAHYIEDVLSLSEFVIIDHRQGGTGVRIPDDQLTKLFHQVPSSRIFLAGGLNPGNVADVIQSHSPYAVDVQSGVLGADGEQDPEMVRKFVAAVRSIAAPEA